MFSERVMLCKSTRRHSIPIFSKPCMQTLKLTGFLGRESSEAGSLKRNTEKHELIAPDGITQWGEETCRGLKRTSCDLYLVIN